MMKIKQKDGKTKDFLKFPRQYLNKHTSRRVFKNARLFCFTIYPIRNAITGLNTEKIRINGQEDGEYRFVPNYGVSIEDIDKDIRKGQNLNNPGLFLCPLILHKIIH